MPDWAKSQTKLRVALGLACLLGLLASAGASTTASLGNLSLGASHALNHNTKWSAEQPSPKLQHKNAPPKPETYARPTGKYTTIVTGLAAPWQVVFLPDGQALVNERDSGRVLQISESYQVTKVSDVGVRPPCTEHCEGGALGMEVVQDRLPAGVSAAAEPYLGWSLFIFYTTLDDNRIAKYDLTRSESGAWSMANQRVILRGINRSKHSTTHNGGRLEIGPDGKLWVGLGDAGTKAYTSQSLKRLAGSILRVNLDGSVPKDNPIKGSYIYTKGNRDTQGLTWDPFGNMWITEFGEDDWDEINLVRPRANYGWPIVEGNYYFKTTIDATDKKFTAPIITYPPVNGACSGMNYFKGSLFIACLRGSQVKVVPVVDDKRLGEVQEYFKGQFGRLRQIVPAPDGSLWLLTSNNDGRPYMSAGGASPDDDRILRIEVEERPLTELEPKGPPVAPKVMPRLLGQGRG